MVWWWILGGDKWEIGVEQATYLVFLPVAARVAHSVGQYEAVARWREVQHPLGYHKTHPEEQITGWQEWNHQQYKAKCQSPKNTERIIYHNTHFFFKERYTFIQKEHIKLIKKKQ